MIVASVIVCLPVLVYAVVVLGWRAAWLRAPHFARRNADANVSVVVCLHNEAHNVGRLVKSFQTNDLTNHEVLFVCDHCTDNTEALLRSLVGDVPNMHVLVNDGPQGKKYAQRQAVGAARYKIVATIDADCSVPSCWLSAVAAYHAEYEPGMLIAPVAMRGDGSFFGRLVELEFLAMQMCTAGAALGRRPFMCNAANMSFVADVFKNHDQNTAYASGDDMFLLAAVKRSGAAVGYLKTADALVSTDAPSSVSAYVRQRTRWLRKASGYTDNYLIFCSLLMFLGNASLPAATVLSAVGVCSWGVLAGVFGVKFVVDYLLLLSGRKFWGVNVDFVGVLVLSVLYPLMVLGISVLSVFRRRRKW